MAKRLLYKPVLPLEVPDDDDESYEIVNLLNNPTLIPIFQIKKNPNLSGKSQRILTSLGNHIEEIIGYIFEDHPTPLGTRCYLAIQSSQEKLMKQMIEKGLLQVPAIKLMSQENPPLLAICRLAGVTYATIMCRPAAISQSCGYIFQLLDYINLPSIFDFFFQLVGSNEDLAEAQKWLVSVKFESVIIQQIKNTPIDDPKLKYLFKLCAVTRFSPIIYPTFTTSQVVSILCGKVTTLYEDDRWEALFSLYNDNTRVYMQSLFPMIIQKLKEPFLVCNRFHIAILGILTKIIVFDEGLHPFIATSDLSPIVMHILNTFPNHSILLSMMEKFLVASFKIPEIAAQIAPAVIPFCMQTAQERKNITISAFSMKILNFAASRCFADQLLKNLLKYIPGFRQFLKADLAEYNKLEKNSYGGESEGMEPKRITV